MQNFLSLVAFGIIFALGLGGSVSASAATDPRPGLRQVSMVPEPYGPIWSSGPYRPAAPSTTSAF